jgi:hypothetical protein
MPQQPQPTKAATYAANKMLPHTPNPTSAPPFVRGFVQGAAPELKKEYRPLVSNVLWNSPDIYNAIRFAHRVGSSIGGNAQK